MLCLKDLLVAGVYSDITMFCKSYFIELLFNYGACSGREWISIVCENLVNAELIQLNDELFVNDVRII